MRPEAKLNSGIPVEKLYSPYAISVATGLGGPLAGGYLIASNFRELGNERKHIIAILVSLALTVLIFGVLAFASFLDRFPDALFPMVFGATAYFSARVLQGAAIDSHLLTGGAFHSVWRVTVLALVAGLLQLGALLAVVYLAEPSIELRNYGSTQNEISFPLGTVEVSESDTIAAALRDAGFFNDEYKNYVYVEKKGSSLELYFNYERSRVDYRLLRDLKDLRNEIQTRFPNKRIIISVVDGDISNSVARFE